MTEPPPLVEAETPGHTFACWYPVGSDVWKATKARLAEAGVGEIRTADVDPEAQAAEAATLAVDPIVDLPPAPNAAGGD